MRFINYKRGKTLESSLAKRLTCIIGTIFIIVICAPMIASATGTIDPEQIAKMSESNPYQSLVYALASMLAVSLAALAWIYQANISQVREQYGILKSLSDNIATQNGIISKNQEIVQKSLDVVNDKLSDKPCLLDSSIIIDLLKNRKN